MRVLLGAAIGGLLLGAAPSPQAPDAAVNIQTIDVTAERFAFTPSQIRTTLGTTLRIRLTSDDTTHGFRIVGTGVDLEIPKRGRAATVVTFTPEHAGRYEFEC